ncbi:hypothetical protein ACFE04_008562 [Oxalis oulophora]
MVLFCSCLVLIAATYNAAVEAAEEFQVGGDFGWQEPAANNSAVYSHYRKETFSDSRMKTLCILYSGLHLQENVLLLKTAFKYQNDSVLVVDKWDYYHCITTDPIASFNNGETVIKLDRPGPFYFISGNPDHCKKGQNLLVDVLDIHQSPAPAMFPPESAPVPAHNSSVLVSVALSLVFVALIFSCLCFVCCWP